MLAFYERTVGILQKREFDKHTPLILRGIENALHNHLKAKLVATELK